MLLKGILMNKLILFLAISIISTCKLSFANLSVDSTTIQEFRKAEKILWISEITSISSIVVLCLSGESLYETYGNNSDVIFISKDKRVAWGLFAVGIISEGLSIAGISFGIKRIKTIREKFEINLSTNSIGAKYSLAF